VQGLCPEEWADWVQKRFIAEARVRLVLASDYGIKEIGEYSGCSDGLS
jgi:hypothetical protein